MTSSSNDVVPAGFCAECLRCGVKFVDWAALWLHVAMTHYLDDLVPAGSFDGLYAAPHNQLVPNAPPDPRAWWCPFEGCTQDGWVKFGDNKVSVAAFVFPAGFTLALASSATCS